MFQAVDEEQVFLTGRDFFDCCANFRNHNKSFSDDDWRLTLKAELKKLKVVNWYNVLRRRSGMTTAHSMQRKFASESFGRSEEGTFHSHTWSGYKEGKHLPNASTIERVEGMMPGSAHEFQLMLWSALDVTQPIGKHANTSFAKMDLHIQKSILNEPSKIYKGLTRKASNTSIASSIYKKCTLDSLAALTILTREAIEANRMEEAYFWGCNTYSMLIILGQELHNRGVACSIIKIYCELIFRKITWDGFHFEDTEDDIIAASAHLAHLVFETSKNKKLTLAWEEREACMKKLLRGQFGCDVLFAMQPRWAPMDGVSKERLLVYERIQRVRAWGWDSIYGRVPCGQFPPDEVLNGMPSTSKIINIEN
jgi:hypothetical protein